MTKSPLTFSIDFEQTLNGEALVFIVIGLLLHDRHQLQNNQKESFILPTSHKNTSQRNSVLTATMAKTEATQVTVQVATPKQRGGVLGRLFRRSPRGTSPKASLSPTIVNKQDKRDRTPSPKNSADDETPRDVPEMHPEVTPVVAPKQTPPKQEPPKQTPPQENKTRDSETPVSDDHPAAVESAFFGPPRYRWMDIVSLRRE